MSTGTYADGTKLELRMINAFATDPDYISVEPQVMYNGDIVALASLAPALRRNVAWTDWFYAGSSYLTSDVPGVPARHVGITAMGFYARYDGLNYRYQCGLSGVNENSSHWTRDASGCDSISMWTYNE